MSNPNVVDEFTAGINWIIATVKPAVTAKVGSRVYFQVQPEGAAYPAVVVQTYGDPVDTVYQTGTRVSTKIEFMVRAWEEQKPTNVSIKNVAAISALFDAVLNTTQPVILDGYRISSCRRISTSVLSYEGPAGPVQGYGGRYSIIVSKA